MLKPFRIFFFFCDNWKVLLADISFSIYLNFTIDTLIEKYQSECILASCALQWHSNKTSIYFAWAPSIKWGSKCVNEHLCASHTYLTEEKKCRQSKVKQVPTQWFFNKHSLRVTTLDNLKHLINPKIFSSQCSNKCSYIVHKTMLESVGHLSKMGIYACVLP